MAIIYSYPLNDNIKSSDELVGTTSKLINGQFKNVTRNFLLSDLTEFFVVNGGLQKIITLTTQDSGGPATWDPLTGVLNIPVYNSSGGGGVTNVTASFPLTSTTGNTPNISTSMASGKLIGRWSTGSGVMQEITIGSGLSLSNVGVLTSDVIATQDLQSVTNAGSTTTNSITASSFIRQDGGGNNILLDNGDTIAITSLQTDLTSVQTSTNFTINSSTGTDATIPLGDGTYAGATINNYSTAEKNKLAGITPGANIGVVPNSPITGSTKTKITYDSKGLVTAGAAATTLDIADSANRRYVTDANLTVIGNTSGVNTGNQNLQNVTTLGATTTAAITATSFVKSGGLSTQLLSANGDSIVAGTNITISGGIISSTGGGSVTPAALTKVDDTNITLTLGGSPTTALLQATSLTIGWTGTLADGRITSSGNWNTAYNNRISTINTTRTSGAATFINNILDIPNYSSGGGGSPLTTKGDLYTFSTSNDRLGVGTNGQILMADSTTSTGLKWAVAGGVGTVTSIATTGLISGGTITSSGTISTSMASGRLVGRSTAGVGIMEEITVSTGLNLSGGILTATGSVSPLTTKGDLYTFNSSNARLAVGNDTQILIADSTEATGLRWGTNTAVTGVGISGNIQTGATQTLATGESGTNFGITSSGNIQTFNLPVASATDTGKLSSANWSTFNSKAGSGANTDITSVALTTGTISTAPSGLTDIVNKSYVDTIATGINFHQACNYATATVLPAYTYANGPTPATPGIGATITGNSNGALVVDGVTVTVTTPRKRVLVKNELVGNAPYNGVYTVERVGNGGNTYQLMRATDYDTVGTGTNEIDQGDMVLVLAGTVNVNTSWVQQNPIDTVGTDPITFVQFAAVQIYTNGTGLGLTSNQFYINNTGVNNATYGSTTTSPVIAVNQQGQITNASNVTITPAVGSITGTPAGVLTFLATPTSANLKAAVTTTSTGAGALVFADNPVLTTPSLGVATATSINRITLFNNGGTADAGLSITTGKTVYFTSTLTFSGTDTSGILFGTGGTVAYKGSGLNQFAVTSSADLAGVISGTTGTGDLVFATSPNLTTPSLGAATATSINKISITAPAGGSTGTITIGALSALTVAAGKTLTANSTLTLAGIDSKTLTINNSLILGGVDSSTIAFGNGGTVAYTSTRKFALDSSQPTYSYTGVAPGTGVSESANTWTIKRIVTTTAGVSTQQTRSPNAPAVWASRESYTYI